jgi:hypothetical protein
MKKLLLVIGVVAILIFVWFLSDAIKPKLFARVDVKGDSIVITNGNDTQWQNPAIILNDTFDGPMLEVFGSWQPGERRNLQLRQFKTRFNGQAFDPEFEKVREVFINVKGFQMGMYRSR